ncbi:uncharacterized protein LOC136082351 [Hydra vulgaris]|uniref:Uncharacterized protein LOC136082351 n=1 Tax=Hydra vulgaris TaxID=6087 RepID=A0ABM4C762_HYDVU
MVNWLEKQWLPQIKRWAYFYRKDRLMVSINTNNGVKRQNETFKHSYLKKLQNLSLTSMLTVLIEEHFPDLYNRYCEINTKSSGQYRQYSSYLPSFLHHRPRHFVKYCLQKMSLAQHIDSSGLLVREPGMFTCQSFTNSGEFYDVSFGDSVTMPNCTCHDWKTTGYLCKHFFAIFNKYPALNWYTLSKLYINKPFLNLDSEIAFSKKPISPTLNQQIITEKETEHKEINSNDKKLEALPKQKTWFNTKAAAFRDLAKQLINDSFIIENEEVLENGIDILKTIKNLFDNSIPNEQGVHLQPIVKKNKGKFQKLNIPQQKKHDFLKIFKKKRHGVGAEKRRSLKNFTIVTNNKKKKLPLETVEVETCENLETEKDEFSVAWNMFNNNNLLNLPLETDMETVQGEHCIDWFTLDNNRFILPQAEITIIKNNDMLTDLSINAAQFILQNQFHVKSGFQDTIFGKKYLFKEEKGQFIQVLHTGQYHWITVSNVNCPVDTIYYYDSLFHGKVNDHVKKQICNIYKTKGKILTVQILKCQQQINGVDCGVFAIANAFNILNKTDVGTLSLDRNKIRSHFLECIGNRNFAPFPLSQAEAPFNKEKIITLEISCSCRSYWLWYHAKNPALHMVQCDTCSEWFHRKCENISDKIFKKINAEKYWTC